MVMKFSKNAKSLVAALSLIMAILLCCIFVSANEVVALDEVKFFSEGEQIYTKVAGDVVAYAYLSNSDAEAKDVWLVASVYNGNKLSDISIAKESVPGGAEREKFATSVISVKAGEECKVLVWDSAFAPICTPVSLTDTSSEKSIDSFALTLGGKTYNGYINNETNVITVPIDTKYSNATVETGTTSNNIKNYGSKDSSQLLPEEVEIGLESAIPTATFSGTLDKELIAGDFSSPFDYKVTAADGSSTTYTVEVDRNIIKYANNFTILGGTNGLSTYSNSKRYAMIDLNTKYIGLTGYDAWWWLNDVWDFDTSNFASTHAGLKTGITTDGSNKYFTLDATGRTSAPAENDMAFYLNTLYANLRDNSGSHVMGSGYTARFKVRYEGVTTGVGTILPSYYNLSGDSVSDSNYLTKGIMFYLKANSEGKLCAYVKDAETEIKLSDEAFDQSEWLEVMVTYEINPNAVTPAEGNVYYNSSMSFYINNKYLGSVNIKSGVPTVRLTDRTLNIGFAYTSDKIKMDMDDYFFSMTPSAPEAKLYSAKMHVEDKVYNGLIKDNTIKFEVPTELSTLADAKIIAGCEDIGNAEYKIDLSSGSASLTVGKAAYAVSAETVTEKINAPFETGAFGEFDNSNCSYILSTEPGITNSYVLLSPSFRENGTTVSINDGKLVINKTYNSPTSGELCKLFVKTEDLTESVKGFSVSYDLCFESGSTIGTAYPLYVTMPDKLETYFYNSSYPLVDRYKYSGSVTALTGNTYTSGKTYRFTYVYKLDNGVVTSEMYINGKYAGSPTNAFGSLASSGNVLNMYFDVTRNGYLGTISIDNFIYNVIK